MLPQALAFCRLCLAFAKQALFLRERKNILGKKNSFNKSFLKASAHHSTYVLAKPKQKRGYNLFPPSPR